MATEPAAARSNPALRREAQTAMYARAKRTLPGGTDSNFRAWGDDTIYVDRGKGGYVWDIDGNEFIDLRMGYGPVILGHGDDRVDDYVNERMRKGVSFSLTSEDEVQAMELVKEMTGWIDKVRMTVSGTEATMHAMRIARAYTGRDRIVKFEGQYHGVHDYALISVAPDVMSELGDADAPVRLAWGRGIPDAVADTIIPARYNNIEALRRLFEARGEEIAAIIVEPVLGNAQGIMPKPGFHQAMRALTEEFGILLIFDEVKTGFRFAKGGAAEFFGVTPDLATYAKAMGNGYPAAAFGGREEVMSVLPDKVSHGGTYAGNRVAAAAAVKTLQILRDTDALEVIHATGRRVQAGLREVLNPTGLPYHFTGHPSMFGIMFSDVEASEYRDWATTDHELYDAVAIGMHARGAMPEPDSREPWFFCEAHAQGDIVDRVVSIFSDSLDAALEARAHGDIGPEPTWRDVTSGSRLNGPGGMVLDGNAVRSVDRAAALLLALGESQGEAGVTELARRLGLHKSTASRLLATLQKRGLVEQDDETGKYRLGLVVIRLAERAERTLDLRGIALPELERLARLTHETTGLGILEGDTMLAVAQVDGPNLIAVGDWTGRATPLHCVASGKVLLSSLAEREVLRIVRRGLVSYTERTIVELEPLLEELARIRRRGYAMAIGEYEMNLNAVAAPVHDARGNVIAAVDIWGPAFRVTPRRVPELAAQAREAAAAISIRLGGTAPERPTPVHATA